MCLMRAAVEELGEQKRTSGRRKFYDAIDIQLGFSSQSFQL